MASDDERRVQMQLQQELQVAYMQEFYSVSVFFLSKTELIVSFLRNVDDGLLAKKTSSGSVVFDPFRAPRPLFLPHYGFKMLGARRL
jgi:hypothetical protein